MKKVLKKKLTDEQLQELLDDWFDRDGTCFVRKSTRSRVLSEGEYYSDYILAAPTPRELFKRAYPIAKNLLDTMDLPYPVSIAVGGSGSYINYAARKIVVATDVFEDKELDSGFKLDVFLGCAVHEGCHARHTDYSQLKRLRNGIDKYLENVLEDERIEAKESEFSPGYMGFLERTKYYYFDKMFRERMAKKPWDKLTKSEKFFELFMRLIRYPKYMREEDLHELGDYLLKVKEILTPYPTCSEEVVTAAMKIADLIKEFIAEENAAERMGLSGMTPEEREEREEEDGPIYIEITAEDLEKALEEIERDLGPLFEILGKMRLKYREVGDDVDGGMTATFVLKDPYIVGEIEGSVERPDGNSFIERQRNDEEKYLRAFVKVKQYVPAIRNHLRNHSKGWKVVHKSTRSGQLDTAKLAEAIQGVPTVYEREGWIKAEGVNLVYLGDESGSMGGESIVAARECGVLIREALMGLPNVNLYMYGHSADIHGRATDLYVYHEPGYTPKYSLGSMRARSQNRDGAAIWLAASRVRKMNNQPTIMFVASDGAPCASDYDGDAGVRHTREMVKKVQSVLGMRVIQIAINDYVPSAQMFDHYIKFTDMRTLAKDLGKVVLKAVEKMSVVKVS